MGSVTHCPEKPMSFNYERMSERHKAEPVGCLPAILLNAVIQVDLDTHFEEATSPSSLNYTILAKNKIVSERCFPQL